MNREDVLRMARQAGFYLLPESEAISDVITVQRTLDFAAAIRSATKEEDARICEEQSKRWHADQRDVYVTHECVAAIRASK